MSVGWSDCRLGELAPAVTLDPELHVYDVTLRDGLQAPGATLSVADAGNLAAALDDFGVAYIEAGVPARADEREQIESVRDAVSDATAVGLAGVDPAEVDAVLDADLGLISLFAGGSPIHRGEESVSTRAARVSTAVDYGSLKAKTPPFHSR